MPRNVLMERRALDEIRPAITTAGNERSWGNIMLIEKHDHDQDVSWLLLLLVSMHPSVMIMRRSQRATLGRASLMGVFTAYVPPIIMRIVLGVWRCAALPVAIRARHRRSSMMLCCEMDGKTPSVTERGACDRQHVGR